MSATTFPALWTDSIAVDKIDGKLYKVAKVNPKNIKCIATDGTLWTIDARRLRAADAAEQEKFKATQPDPTELVPFRIGTVCRFTGSYAQKHGDQPMVVIKEKAGDLVSLAWLGGDVRRRYFASVPIQSLELVDGHVPVTNV